jgi:hypothetical protein
MRSLLFPLILAGGVLVGLVVLQTSWAIGRLALRQVREALLGAQGLSRRPYPSRLRRCVALLDSDQPPTLVEAMHRCQLLPKEFVATASAAEASGPETLAAYFTVLAQPSAPSRILTALTPYIGVLLVTGVLVTFQMIYIIPKMEYVARDLGIHLDPLLKSLVMLSRNLPWYLLAWLPTPVGMIAIALCLSVVIGWRRRWGNRSALAQVVMERITAQATERDIAHLVAKARPRHAQSVLAAGEQGDFSGISAACGFAASNPAQLAVALANWQRRRERLLGVLAMAARILTPVIVAIPVAFLCVGFHRTLLNILFRLLGEELQ